MKELVVISGKGGTGKTSLVASFAVLAKETMLADCDVDAPDLHLLLEPSIVRRGNFSGGSRARIISRQCTACRKCEEVCRFNAISFDGPAGNQVSRTFRVDPIACEGCGVCAWFCPEKAIEFAPADNGQWFVSDTRLGPMVHARLGIAEENSGKLVSLVRHKAKDFAVNRKLELTIVDGPPGIGCPVIASITGADLVLVVTEPTLSGLHDLERVTELTKHFGIRTSVCVNKWDLNATLTSEIELRACQSGVDVVGRIRYDPTVTKAQINKKTLVETTNVGATKDIKKIWATMSDKLGSVFALSQSR